MAPCHLIPDLKFTFLGNIYLGKLNNTGRQFVADGHVETFLRETASASLYFMI